MEEDVKVIKERFKIIGRDGELLRALAAAKAGKHILFEGVVGVGKTIIALSIARHLNRSFFRVDGDERYTEHKLTGWFDPPLVIEKGYSWESFIPGPLTQAMLEGAFLFINELNRMPEGTQNVLLPAMDERQIIIPKIGTIKAKPGFLIIATQNPEEFVGTSRLSEALRDRFVWIRLDYQPENEEILIVEKETNCRDRDTLTVAVRIARETRKHPDIRRGSSVRGAIDMVDLIRNFTSTFKPDLDLWTKVATAALATKIELQDQTAKNMEEIVRGIVASVLENYKNKNGERRVASLFSGSSVEKEESETIRRLKTSIERGDVSTLMGQLRSNPKSISDLLSEEGLFEKMLMMAERSPSSWMAAQLLFLLRSGLDPKRRRTAKRILTRMIMRLAAQISGRGLSATRQVSVPFKPGLEEFDIDQTLENMLGKSLPDSADLISIERQRKKSAVSLMLDVSNSMQLEKIVIATLAVGVLAHKLRDDHYCVITFNDHPKILKTATEESSIEALIGKMLDIQPKGATNIEEALRVGLEELRKVNAHERVGILVTDGWVTKGADPINTAGKYPRLHVVQVPMGIGGGSFTTCKRLAKASRGKYSYVKDFNELPRALMRTLN